MRAVEGRGGGDLELEPGCKNGLSIVPIHAGIGEQDLE